MSSAYEVRSSRLESTFLLSVTTVKNKMSLTSAKLNGERTSNHNTVNGAALFNGISPQESGAALYSGSPVLEGSQNMTGERENNAILPPVDDSLIEDDETCFPLITSVYSLADSENEPKTDDVQATSSATNVGQRSALSLNRNETSEANLCNKFSYMTKPIKMKEYAAVVDESPSGYKLVCKKKDYEHYTEESSTEGFPIITNGKPYKTKEYTAIPDDSSAGYKMVVVQSPKTPDEPKAKHKVVSSEQTDKFYTSHEKYVLTKTKSEENAVEKPRVERSPPSDTSPLIDLGQTQYGPMKVHESSHVLPTNANSTGVSTASTPTVDIVVPSKRENEARTADSVSSLSRSKLETTSADRNDFCKTSPLSQLEKQMTELVRASQSNNAASQLAQVASAKANDSSAKVSVDVATPPPQKTLNTTTPKGTFYLNVPVDTQTIYIVHNPEGTKFFTVPQGANLTPAALSGLTQGQHFITQNTVLPQGRIQKTFVKSPHPIAPKPETETASVSAKPALAPKPCASSYMVQLANRHSQSNLQVPGNGGGSFVIRNKGGSPTGSSSMSSAVSQQQKVFLITTRTPPTSPTQETVSYPSEMVKRTINTRTVPSQSFTASSSSNYGTLTNPVAISSPTSGIARYQNAATNSLSTRTDKTAGTAASLVTPDGSLHTSLPTTKAEIKIGNPGTSNVCTPSSSPTAKKKVASRSLFAANNDSPTQETVKISAPQTQTSVSLPAQSDTSTGSTPPVSTAGSTSVGLTPHEAKIQRLKELMKQQEDALEKVREKRKRDVDSIREAAGSMKESKPIKKGQTEMSKVDLTNPSNTFLAPAPPKSSSPFARSLIRSKECGDHGFSTPAKKQKTDTLNTPVRSTRGSTTSAETESRGAFVPNADDQKFVRLVGLETVVDGLSNKENRDKLDR